MEAANPFAERYAAVVADFWHARGIVAATVERLDLRVVIQGGRAWLRYPVRDGDGRACATVRSAVDGASPCRAWDGSRRPDLLYNPAEIIAGAPLYVVATVSDVWRLSSLPTSAVTFLCGPRAPLPARAVGQIVAGHPSVVVVIDDGVGQLPGGAAAVVRALRDAGLEAGGYRVPPASPVLAALGWTGQSAAYTIADLADWAGGDPDRFDALVALLEPVTSVAPASRPDARTDDPDGPDPSDGRKE